MYPSRYGTHSIQSPFDQLDPLVQLPGQVVGVGILFFEIQLRYIGNAFHGAIFLVKSTFKGSPFEERIQRMR